MTDYLIFMLTAALASTGEFAGHERRGSVGWPGRSALLGMVAAAQGIRRDEADRLAELEQLKTAVAVFDEGGPLRDYHTVMTVPTAKAKRPNSRREALSIAGQDVNTIITKRDYRSSPLFGIALWGPNLDVVRNNLLCPHFNLYFGRKSCPLAAPLAPEIVHAETVEAALTQLALPPWYNAALATHMFSDATEETHAVAVETRNDQVLDRAKWHFGPRQVSRVAVQIELTGADTP